MVVEQDELGMLEVGSQINTIQWLPRMKSSTESRSDEEYYGEENDGNVVFGCNNNGVYLYALRRE